MLWPSDVAAQLSFDCGSTDETCLNAVNQQGEPQGCSVNCGPCTFFFYCQPQDFAPFSGENDGCYIYWECPGLANGQVVDISLDGEDEGINSGSVQTVNGNFLSTLQDINPTTNPFGRGFFNLGTNYGTSGVQQDIFITITDFSTGQVLCQTQYYYNCY
jgi:hypothetical protein